MTPKHHNPYPGSVSYGTSRAMFGNARDLPTRAYVLAELWVFYGRPGVRCEDLVLPRYLYAYTFLGLTPDPPKPGGRP